MTKMLSRATAFCALFLALASPAAYAGFDFAPYVAYANNGEWSDAVAAGDINGDGRDDVVVTAMDFSQVPSPGIVFVYLQQANGTLQLAYQTTFAPYVNTTGLALADLDRDGRKEIIVGYDTGISIIKWGPFRDGLASVRAYPLPSPYGAYNVAVLDVDRDGHPDIVGQDNGSGATILFGDGHAGVSRALHIPTHGAGDNDIEVADFNHDGYQDLMVLSGQGVTHAYVYYNDGTDDLSPPLEIDPYPGSYVFPGASGAGDFDGDGRDDLILLHANWQYYATLKLFAQDANGSMGAPSTVYTALNPQALLAYDLDRDGRDDLIVSHRGGSVGVHLQGDAGLGEEKISQGPYRYSRNPQGIAVGDVNDDGCPDIVDANHNAGLVVHPGAGCDAAPDLIANVGLTASRVAVRLDNVGNGAASQPRADVTLTAGSGTLFVSALPAGCSVVSQVALRIEVRCVDATLVAGTSTTRTLSIGVSGGNARNFIDAAVRAATASTELRYDNNSAQKRLYGTFGAAPASQSTLNARAARLLRLREARR